MKVEISKIEKGEYEEYSFIAYDEHLQKIIDIGFFEGTDHNKWHMSIMEGLTGYCFEIGDETVAKIIGITG